jgi:hypothetical protein
MIPPSATCEASWSRVRSTVIERNRPYSGPSEIGTSRSGPAKVGILVSATESSPGGTTPLQVETVPLSDPSSGAELGDEIRSPRSRGPGSSARPWSASNYMETREVECPLAASPVERRRIRLVGQSVLDLARRPVLVRYFAVVSEGGNV